MFIPQLLNETKQTNIIEMQEIDLFSPLPICGRSLAWPRLWVWLSILKWKNGNWRAGACKHWSPLKVTRLITYLKISSMHSNNGDWKKKKLACITSDNRDNIVAAVRKLEWPWLNCFDHNLNLAGPWGCAEIWWLYSPTVDRNRIKLITEDQPDNSQTEESLDARKGTSVRNAPAIKKMHLGELLGKRKRRRPRFLF